jgi:hypothetical protein
MDAAILIKLLSSDEKKELFKLLAEELLKEPKIEGYTTIDVFCQLKKDEMSTRLRNVLIANSDWLGKYVETINSMNIRRCRNASQNTEREFVELRASLNAL